MNKDKNFGDNSQINKIKDISDDNIYNIGGGITFEEKIKMHPLVAYGAPRIFPKTLIVKYGGPEIFDNKKPTDFKETEDSSEIQE